MGEGREEDAHSVAGENQSAAGAEALKVILKRDAVWTSHSFKMVVMSP